MTTDLGEGPPDAAPWTRSADEVVAELDTDARHGLSVDEAQARLARVGPNRLEGRARASRWELVVDQFRSVLVWVLIAAAAISGLVLRESVDAAVIAVIVVLNAVLGYVQESRAEDALAELRELAAPRATAVRGGRERTLRASDLVPGDVISLAAGDRVPADARLLETRHLTTDEAPLTGESLPVSKQVDPVGAAAVSVGDRSCMVLTGTTIASGRGHAVVTATGPHTEVGAIATLLEAQDEGDTPLQGELATVGRRLAVLALGVAVLLFVIGILRGLDTDEMFLTAVALAVAAIPEGLPAVVTITLALGVRRMAERHAVVRRLPAVEALGSTTVVCTDKTGTLTENRLAVSRWWFPGASDPRRPEGALAERFALVASVCNDAREAAGEALGDPTEIALLRSAAEIADPTALRSRHPRLDEAAFDSARKRMSTVVETADGALLATKGAPETIASRCTGIATPQGRRPLSEEARARFEEEATAFAADGLRTLALAQRTLASRPDDPADAEEQLELIALVGMQDALRPEARDALADARHAGVRVVMVTGDHPVTARHIADDLDMLDGAAVMPGHELHALPEDALAEEVERIGAYARVDPADKVKIVDAWKERGALVAMTGDGVNDAPALRAADIGVAMGSGTDVGKDAADMVLTDDNFATIVAAIREGRRIYANLQKVVRFLLSANAAEILVMAIGILAFASEGSPLLAVQILWINLITDGLPVLALSVDEPADDVMGRPPEPSQSLLGRSEQLRLLARGAVMAAATLAVLCYGYYLRELPWPEVRTLVFTTLVVVQLLYAFGVRVEYGGRWVDGVRRNPALVGTVAASFLLQLAVVYLPFAQTLFDTHPIEAVDWLAVLVAPGLAIVVLEAVARAWPRRTHRTD